MASFPKGIIASLLLSLISVQAGNPFFIIGHQPLVSTRLDSIVTPGGVSGHQHAIIGANTFGPHVDYEASQKAECVSGIISIDKSNYWVPELYRKTKDGFKKMGLSYANTYYFSDRKPAGMPIYEFPPGFRMLAGDSNRRTLDVSDPAQDAISYVCLYTDAPQTHEFPTRSCPGGLRAQAFFPSCWDGTHNWLEGSKHVAYPASGAFDGSGPCPSSHPMKLPQLFFEFIFHDDESYEEGARVWSHGDDLGYGFHADFVNGWPEGKFTEILNYGEECDAFFDLAKCPALKPYIQEGGKCQYKGLVVDEDVGDSTPLAALPGNNPVWGRSGPKTSTAGYVEDKHFIKVGESGTAVQPDGPGKQYAEIAAGNLHIATIKGDPAFSGPTNVPQDGATGGAAAPTTTTPATILPIITSDTTIATTDIFQSVSDISDTATAEVMASTDQPINVATTGVSQPASDEVNVATTGVVQPTDKPINVATTGVTQVSDAMTKVPGNNLLVGDSPASPASPSSSSSDLKHVHPRPTTTTQDGVSETGFCHAKRRRSRAHN